jgi:hypothetical protein
VLTGRCLCGGVRFEVEGPFSELGYCHCKQCQRASGSAFSANTTVARSRLRFVAGEDLLREYESSPDAFRAFCSRCGSPVYKRWQHQQDSLRIRLGLLDGDPGLRARAHFWVDVKPPWYEISDALPQYPEGVPTKRRT